MNRHSATETAAPTPSLVEELERRREDLALAVIDRVPGARQELEELEAKLWGVRESTGFREAAGRALERRAAREQADKAAAERAAKVKRFRTLADRRIRLAGEVDELVDQLERRLEATAELAREMEDLANELHGSGSGLSCRMGHLETHAIAERLGAQIAGFRQLMSGSDMIRGKRLRQLEEEALGRLLQLGEAQ